MRCLTVIAVTLCARVAAAQVSVNPVAVTLTPETRSALIALTNTGNERLRFQVSLSAWGQSPSGEMELTPTKDVTFYPSIFEVSPGETKRVRVGSVTTIARGERTYRVFLDQLPRLEGQRLGVQVLTRLSIPIFATMQPTPPAPAIAMQSATKDGIAFSVSNEGDAHFRIKKVEVTTLDASGAVMAEASESGWYVLGHGSRNYTLPIPACGSAAIEVAVDAEPTATRARIPVAAHCDP
jgi:fimbrial chaperone protein